MELITCGLMSYAEGTAGSGAGGRELAEIRNARVVHELRARVNALRPASGSI